MTRPPSEAVDLTHLIPHLQEHLLHVGCARKGMDFLPNQEAGNSLSVARSRCCSAAPALARCPTSSPESLYILVPLRSKSL